MHWNALPSSQKRPSGKANSPKCHSRDHRGQARQRISADNPYLWTSISIPSSSLADSTNCSDPFPQMETLDAHQELIDTQSPDDIYAHTNGSRLNAKIGSALDIPDRLAAWQNFSGTSTGCTSIFSSTKRCTQPTKLHYTQLKKPNHSANPLPPSKSWKVSQPP